MLMRKRKAGDGDGPRDDAGDHYWPRIRAAMAFKGKPISCLAVAFGLSKGTVYYLDSHNKCLRPDEMKKLCEITGAENLFFRIDEPLDMTGRTIAAERADE